MLGKFKSAPPNLQFWSVGNFLFGASRNVVLDRSNEKISYKTGTLEQDGREIKRRI
jgi:hypothetical protein